MTNAIKDGDLWRCPHCNASHYREGIPERAQTCYPYPVIKDGVNINPDRRIITSMCSCIECEKKFVIER